jgi:T4 RnlA family RNA ligase
MKIKNTYLPTYEEALEICASNETFCENKHIVNGYNISTFNYRLSLYNDFINPIKDKPEINAKELRGLTFVFNKDGSLFKRYLHLQKFWNLNQVEETEYSKLKDLEIVHVADKLDGSLCAFVKLPNGDVVSKTQNSFDNEQTEVINEIYRKNDNLKRFLDYCFERDYNALFEYVSFMNRIVLSYDEPEVILLRVRDKDGNYLNIDDLNTYGTKCAESEKPLKLDDYIELAEEIENKEGWVLTLKDGEEYIMAKVKGSWYCERHRIMEDIERENDVISLTLSESIDDVLGQLDPVVDIKRREFIFHIMGKVNSYVFETMKEVDELVSKFNGDIKEFALDFKKDKNFSMAISVIRGKCDSLTAVKNKLKSKTKRLEEARRFIKNW